MPLRVASLKVGQTAYRVYSDGRVWSCRAKRFLKPELGKDGYLMVTLGKKKFRLARLVLTCFRRKPKPGEQARHRNGDPMRNNLGNLIWGTGAQNWRDRKRHRRIASGRLKLTKKQVEEILAIPVRWGDAKAIAKRYGVSHGRINQLRNNVYPIQSHKTGERA